jgi:hypothetical protein
MLKAGALSMKMDVPKAVSAMVPALIAAPAFADVNAVSTMPLSLEVRWLWCNASLARCVGSGQHTLAIGRRQCRQCLTRKTHNLTALFCLSLGQVTFAAYLAVLLGTFVPVTFLIVLYSQVTRKCARFPVGATT